MWFQHGGCPIYYAHVLRQALLVQFPHSWIGHLGPVRWPPPDLIIDFLWGTKKVQDYQQPPIPE
jgi:hypothetical protein